MKFGFVVDSGGLGGAERQAMILAEGLRKREHEVIFFFLNQNQEKKLEQHLNARDIRSIDLQFTFKSDHLGRFLSILKLVLKLRKFMVDVYLPYTIRPNVNINFLWQFTGAKCCIWNQRDEGRGFAKKKYRDLILWFALKNTSGFISNSDEGLRFLSSYMISRKPVKRINNGILITEPKASREHVLSSLEIPYDALVVTKVANLTRYKDHSTLLRAWKTFLEKNNREPMHMLLLAGALSDKSDTIKTEVTKLGIEHNVRVLGMVDDINSLVHASDLCVFSSKLEGVPNGVLESMAAGKAIVASDIPGIRQALGDDYPFLYQVGNVAELAKLFALLFQEYDESKLIGKRNRRRIEENFNVERLWDETLNFINTIV